MPGAAPEHQGYLGDLHTKSTPELKDLLRRQEAIQQKQNFIRSLPDGGRKVRAFADTLHRLITERQREGVGEVSQMVADISLEKPHGNLQVQPDPPAQHLAETTETGSPSRVVSQFAKLRDKRTEPNPSWDSETTDTKPSDADFCSQIQALSVRDKVLPGRPEPDLSQLINPAHRDKVVIFGEHPKGETETVNSYLKVMQKSERANTKPNFRPNSSLKIHTVEELPEKYRGKVVAKRERTNGEDDGISGLRNPTTGRIVDGKTAESSATPPKYKYDRVKVVSLEESFQLQQLQASKQEALRAQHAAERLAGKIHVKMGRYNPEGEMFTAYRAQTEEDLDSDDNDGEDYPD